MKPSVPPYPLRPRGALELFDASLKLYKRYFWPLMGVSALVWLGTGLGCFFLLSLLSIVSSNDYGENAAAVFPLAVLGVIGVICIIAILIGYIVIGLYFFGALTFLPLVACLEYHSRKIIKPIGRSHQLSWSRPKTLIIVVFTHGLGLCFLSIILTGLTGLGLDLMMAQNFMRGISSDTSVLLSVFAALSSLTVIGMFWSPFYLMTLGTFYVDVRIRKEAFDLEYAMAGHGKMEQTS